MVMMNHDGLGRYFLVQI